MTNNLTPAEAERLAMLAEECAEVIQVIGKILRHGYESHHPETTGVTNRDLLNAEINDISGVIFGMYTANDRITGTSVAGAAEVWRRKLEFTHHQGN